MPATLSLSETVALAQKVLDENKVTPASGRTSAALSARSVRWYTTAGILDAPGRAGHAAAYGRRHLVQLLYTRLAQSEGQTLEDIKEDTAALPTEDLVAQLHLDLSSVPDDLTDVAPRVAPEFWERVPEDSPEPALYVASFAALDASETASSPLPLTRSALRPALSARLRRATPTPTSLSYVVNLGPLAVSLTHEPTPLELDSITSLAQPLLASLTQTLPTPKEL